MSVDYYNCDACNCSRYSEYVGSCTECGNSLCTFCLANDDIDSEYAYRYGVVYDGSEEQKEEYGIEEGWYKIGDVIEDTSIQPKYCPFCNGEKVSERDLFNFALTLLDMNRQDLISKYKDLK